MTEASGLRLNSLYELAKSLDASTDGITSLFARRLWHFRSLID
jgi:hypothetical protein